MSNVAVVTSVAAVAILLVALSVTLIVAWRRRRASRRGQAVRASAARASGETPASSPASISAEPPVAPAIASGPDPYAPVDAAHEGPERSPDGGALVDPVTGLDGVRMWDRVLLQESHRSARHPHPLAVAVAELDGLKVVSDSQDLQAIHRIEKAVADTLVRCARATDRVARIGDGRFGVLLVESNEAGAATYANRVAAASELWLAALPGAVRLRIGAAGPSSQGTLRVAVAEAETRARASRSDGGPKRPLASHPTTIRTTGDRA